MPSIFFLPLPEPPLHVPRGLGSYITWLLGLDCIIYLSAMRVVHHTQLSAAALLLLITSARTVPYGHYIQGSAGDLGGRGHAFLVPVHKEAGGGRGHHYGFLPPLQKEAGAAESEFGGEQIQFKEEGGGGEGGVEKAVEEQGQEAEQAAEVEQKEGRHMPISAQLKNYHQEDHGKPSYKFEYTVHDPHTGDIKRQWEHREGGVVHGQYSLVEPDGSLRTVHYTAHPKTGFQATVHKTGVNKHPIAIKHHHAASAPSGEFHKLS